MSLLHKGMELPLGSSSLQACLWRSSMESLEPTVNSYFALMPGVLLSYFSLTLMF